MSAALQHQAADKHAASIALIAGEVRAVVAVMRRNAKWSLADHSDAGDAQDPLTESFQNLRRKMYTWGDISTVPPLEFLAPFLDVCRSEAASGPITGAALNSLYAILSSSLLRPEAPGAVEAIHAVADAVSHCRFEATDPAHDDTVLARIMSVLLAAIRCPLGHLLSDDHVCAMVYATYHIGHHTGRESALLVHVSRSVLAELVRTVFSRASTSPGNALAAPAAAREVSFVRSSDPPLSPSGRSTLPYGAIRPAWRPRPLIHGTSFDPNPHPPWCQTRETLATIPSDPPHAGVSAACDIFSFIISLIAYDDEQHGDELAAAGLALAARSLSRFRAPPRLGGGPGSVSAPRLA